ncbi:MAG: hypothetical protein IKT92_00055 [Bacteroidaceae bacterium]|nr:hypothetical protein [Bacteroidaceae bacterium]
MKKYIKPQIEVFEFETEDAILSASQLNGSVTDDHKGSDWNDGNIEVLSNKKSGWTSDNWESAW